MMEKRDFNFDNIGKQMPYRTPDNFLSEIEQQAWAKIEMQGNDAGSRRERGIIIGIKSIAAVAASVILLFSLYNAYTKQEIVKYDDVEQAFLSLCEADQDFLLEIYAHELDGFCE